MSAKFEVMATNDITSVKIATKYTLAGALSLCDDLINDWDDLQIREREEGADVFKIVAKLSRHGMI